MKISIMQPGYLPWLGFFELMAHCDLFVILDDVPFTKRDWRSRNRIRTKDGWMWLSVPMLTRGKRKQLILEANINQTQPWAQNHLKSIKIHYRKAKYFDKYINFFESIYTHKWESLFNLDMKIIDFLSSELKIRTPFIRSSSLLIRNVSGNQRIVNICKKMKAKELYDSAGAKNFIDVQSFQEIGVNVIFQNYSHPEYLQVYYPFLPYMSVIDLLLNEGPNSTKILLNEKNT